MDLNSPLPRDKEPLKPVLGLSPCMGLSFPVSDSMCTHLFCLPVCVLKHLANLMYLSSVGSGGDHSDVQKGSMQANDPVLVSRSDRWPWSPTPAAKAELSLYLLLVSKALFHSVLDCTVFSLMIPLPRCSGSLGSVYSLYYSYGKQQMSIAQQYRIKCDHLVANPHVFVFYLPRGNHC